MESWLHGNSTWTACIDALDDVFETTVGLASSRKVPLVDWVTELTVDASGHCGYSGRGRM